MPQNEMSNRGLMTMMSAMNGRALGAGYLSRPSDRVIPGDSAGGDGSKAKSPRTS